MLLHKNVTFYHKEIYKQLTGLLRKCIHSHFLVPTNIITIIIIWFEQSKQVHLFDLDYCYFADYLGRLD